MHRPLGRAEVRRRKQQLDAVFLQLQNVSLSSELVAHFSRYLCVLVSGYVEQSVKELVAQYCRTKSNAEIQRFAGTQMRKVRNIDLDRLKSVLESFDPQWWSDLAAKRPDELSALDSVAAVRNGVSHGSESGITMATITQYYAQVTVVIDDLCDLLDPLPSGGST